MTNEEFQKSILGEIQALRQEVGELKQGQNLLTKKVDNLGQGQKEIKTILEELDPKNANRHLELKESIDELRKDLSTVEIVTASNYADIAKLKSVK